MWKTPHFNSSGLLCMTVVFT